MTPRTTEQLHNPPTRAGHRVSTQTRIIEHLRRGIPRWPAQIAKELGIPPATVDAHLRAITDKGTAPLRVVERRGYVYCHPSELAAAIVDLTNRIEHLQLWLSGLINHQTANTPTRPSTKPPRP